MREEITKDADKLPAGNQTIITIFELTSHIGRNWMEKSTEGHVRCQNFLTF